MRVVVTGASGNVGTSVLESLTRDESVSELVGISRRRPEPELGQTHWTTADVTTSDLEIVFRGADVVIHLAWLIQPSRNEARTHHVNVDGSARVFEAVAKAEVPALVYGSSVGAYAPGPIPDAVDETRATTGIESSFYSRHTAEAERLLDDFESRQPDIRLVRMRPALIFKRDAAREIRRLFAGPFLPRVLLRRGLAPVLPVPRGLRTQAVHSHDVGEAYRLAAPTEVQGAFNIAADPVLDVELLAVLAGAKPLELPVAVVRAAASATRRLRLEPTSPGWLDMGMQSPIMDVSRAHDELGWRARSSSTEALRDPRMPFPPNRIGGPMKALIYDGPHEVRVKQVPDPKIEQPTDVIIKLMTTNIWGSGLHMHEGRTEMETRRILGLENLGEVLEMGSAAQRIKKGDTVCLPFNIGCGFCQNCERGSTGYCLTANRGTAGAAYGFAGMGPYEGGQSEFLRVPFADFSCLELPPDADMMKLFPSPRIPTDKISGCQPHIRRGEHLKLYRFSPSDFNELAAVFNGPHPEMGSRSRSLRSPTPRALRRLTCRPSQPCSLPALSPTRWKRSQRTARRGRPVARAERSRRPEHRREWQRTRCDRQGQGRDRLTVGIRTRYPSSDVVRAHRVRPNYLTRRGNG